MDAGKRSEETYGDGVIYGKVETLVGYVACVA